MAKRGPKLNETHKELLIDLLIQGYSVTEIQGEFLKRMYPEITYWTVNEYARRKDVVERRQQVIDVARQESMANFWRRVQHIERRLTQVNHRAEGTTADPFIPTKLTIGPPVYVEHADFRAFIESEIHLFQELDRILHPPASRTTVRDKDGRIVGTTDTTHEAPAQPLSDVSYLRAANNVKEIMIDAEMARLARLQKEDDHDSNKPA